MISKYVGLDKSAGSGSVKFKGNIKDSDRVTIYDTATEETFEFDDDSTVDGGNTQVEIATVSPIEAIGDIDFFEGINPKDSTNTNPPIPDSVNISNGTEQVRFEFDDDSVIVYGTLGIYSGLNVKNGDTLTIDDGINPPINFEFQEVSLPFGSINQLVIIGSNAYLSLINLERKIKELREELHLHGSIDPVVVNSTNPTLHLKSSTSVPLTLNAVGENFIIDFKPSVPVTLGSNEDGTIETLNNLIDEINLSSINTTVIASKIGLDYSVITPTPSEEITLDNIANSGTTTSEVYGKLVETGKNFLTTVKAGMRIENTTKGNSASVIVVDSDEILSLDKDIMESGDSYKIINTELFSTGDPIFLDVTGGSYPNVSGDPINQFKVYYVSHNSIVENVISLARTLADAQSGTNLIEFTGTGSGTQHIYKAKVRVTTIGLGGLGNNQITKVGDNIQVIGFYGGTNETFSPEATMINLKNAIDASALVQTSTIDNNNLLELNSSNVLDLSSFGEYLEVTSGGAGTPENKYSWKDVQRFLDKATKLGFDDASLFDDNTPFDNSSFEVQFLCSGDGTGLINDDNQIVIDKTLFRDSHSVSFQSDNPIENGIPVLTGSLTGTIYGNFTVPEVGNNILNTTAGVITGDPVVLTTTVSLPLPLASNKTYYTIITTSGFTADITTSTIHLGSLSKPLKTFVTGDAVEFTNSGGALPTPLAPLTTYYLIKVSDTRYKVATTYANAIANVPITITGTGTGSHTVTLDGVKLAITAANAANNIPIDITSAGSGIHTISKRRAFITVSQNKNPRITFEGFFIDINATIEFPFIHFDNNQNVQADISNNLYRTDGEATRLLKFTDCVYDSNLSFVGNDCIAKSGSINDQVFVELDDNNNIDAESSINYFSKDDSATAIVTGFRIGRGSKLKHAANAFTKEVDIPYDISGGKSEVGDFDVVDIDYQLIDEFGSIDVENNFWPGQGSILLGLLPSIVDVAQVLSNKTVESMSIDILGRSRDETSNPGPNRDSADCGSFEKGSQAYDINLYVDLSIASGSTDGSETNPFGRNEFLDDYAKRAPVNDNIDYIFKNNNVGNELAGLDLGPETYVINTISDFTTNFPANKTLTLTTPGKYYKTTDKVTLSTTGTLPTPLSSGVTYFCVRISRTHIELATTVENALNGITIVITDNGTGVHTLTKTTDYNGTGNIKFKGYKTSILGIPFLSMTNTFGLNFTKLIKFKMEQIGINWVSGDILFEGTGYENPDCSFDVINSVIRSDVGAVDELIKTGTNHLNTGFFGCSMQLRHDPSNEYAKYESGLHKIMACAIRIKQEIFSDVTVSDRLVVKGNHFSVNPSGTVTFGSGVTPELTILDGINVWNDPNATPITDADFTLISGSDAEEIIASYNLLADSDAVRYIERDAVNSIRNGFPTGKPSIDAGAYETNIFIPPKQSYYVDFSKIGNSEGTIQNKWTFEDLKSFIENFNNGNILLDREMEFLINGNYNGTSVINMDGIEADQNGKFVFRSVNSYNYALLNKNTGSTFEDGSFLKADNCENLKIYIFSMYLKQESSALAGTRVLSLNNSTNCYLYMGNNIVDIKHTYGGVNTGQKTILIDSGWTAVIGGNSFVEKQGILSGTNEMISFASGSKGRLYANGYQGTNGKSGRAVQNHGVLSDVVAKNEAFDGFTTANYVNVTFTGAVTPGTVLFDDPFSDEVDVNNFVIASTGIENIIDIATLTTDEKTDIDSLELSFDFLTVLRYDLDPDSNVTSFIDCGALETNGIIAKGSYTDKPSIPIAVITDKSRNMFNRSQLGEVKFKIMGYAFGRGGYVLYNPVKVIPISNESKPSTATITIINNSFDVDDSIILGGFVDGPIELIGGVGQDWDIGATPDETATNISNAINDNNVLKNKMFSTAEGNVVTITSGTIGTIGNKYTLTESDGATDNMTVTTFSGGTDEEGLIDQNYPVKSDEEKKIGFLPFTKIEKPEESALSLLTRLGLNENDSAIGEMGIIAEVTDSNISTANGTLDDDITETDSVINLVSGSSFPNGKSTISIEDEIIKITSRNNNTLIVEERGAYGTTAVPHSELEKAYLKDEIGNQFFLGVTHRPLYTKTVNDVFLHRFIVMF